MIFPQEIFKLLSYLPLWERNQLLLPSSSPLCGRGIKGEGVIFCLDKAQTANLGRGLRRQGTPAERILWSKLRNKQLNGVKFRGQQRLGNYLVDFVSFEKKLVIEVDGGQHSEDRILEEDSVRTAWLNSQDFRVMRFWNNEIIHNLEGVLIKIEAVLGIKAPSPFSSSPIEGEENGREGVLSTRGEENGREGVLSTRGEENGREGVLSTRGEEDGRN
jgi:very-short-patch-repair endonuclease